MANALRLAFVCFLSVLLGAEWFAWIAGYGLNVGLIVVAAIALVVMVVYMVWDYCSLEEQLDDLKVAYSQLDSIYKQYCQDKIDLQKQYAEWSKQVEEKEKLVSYA